MNALSNSRLDPAALPGVLTIDLSALRGNWRLLAERAAPAVCGAVVKANAYGLGAAEVAAALYHEGCRHFFVANLTEAAVFAPSFHLT
jgi:alanine racemase